MVEKANKYYDILFACFERIAENPFMFPEAEHIKKGYRQCVCEVDTIYFKVKEDNIIEIFTLVG